ncbi:MAG: DUF1587 domain-containing protein, partial [Planctomycetales bacterium]
MKIHPQASVFLTTTAASVRATFPLVIIAGALLASLVSLVPLAAAEPDAETRRAYQTTIRPLLKRYCDACHGPETAEAEINLAAFGKLDDLRRRPKTWIKVRRMLDSGEMPPKDERQPTDVEREHLRTWTRSFLAQEAEANAGDPGPVVLRRLSNAEYAYTIRDLTGVRSLDPTREFPVGGAAGEGFTNTGGGQGMSPSLVRKYLDAGKRIAARAVLLPDGIRFSAQATRRDQTNELLAKIQEFYRPFTQDGGGSAINLHGIKFDTNRGGLLSLQKYLTATLAERDALIAGRKTIADVARERSLSPRYLASLWDALTDDASDNHALLLGPLRAKWRQAKADDAATLAAEIQALQKSLWKFNSIGHIGREGGPKSWLEAVSPITAEQPLRLTTPESPDGSDVVIFLTASDLASDSESGFVIWRNARIEYKADKSQPARPPLALRDVRAAARNLKGTLASQAGRAKQYLQAVLLSRTA